MVLFVLHQRVVLPFFELPNSVLVIYQHLLLGGMSLVIFAVTFFVSQHFFSQVGFAVLGFLLLKMVFLAVFVNAYESELNNLPVQKYILLTFYLIYLVFLLLKIIPFINVNKPEKPS